jgi:hypothetical protein
METKESAFHLSAIALLAQSEKVTSLSISNGTLEDIAVIIKLYGGEVHVIEGQHNTILCRSKIENCHLWIHVQTTNLACVLQKESFQSNESIFEKGTNLIIIDNQYVVLSDATK